MEKRIITIMSKVFGIDDLKINESSSPDNIQQWDSLRHMQLIIALENEFNIEIDGNRIEEMMNYSNIVKVIRDLQGK